MRYEADCLTQPPHFELANLPDPRCGPGQVVIRTAYCGVGGTDPEILRGTMPVGLAALSGCARA
jgi:D-arabinose 1-dehydrogenase-like Zn-dependent alcohol dehydrogenase